MADKPVDLKNDPLVKEISGLTIVTEKMVGEQLKEAKLAKKQHKADLEAATNNLNEIKALKHKRT